MNNAGTLLAVVGPDNSTASSRTAAVEAILTKRNVSAKQLKGESREHALNTFLAGAGWHRGADVDRLSKEEAQIIAARIVRRTEAKTPLPKEKADALRSMVANTIARRFIEPGAATPQRMNTAAEEVLNAARTILSQDEIAAFEQALKQGYRPLPSEQ